MSADQRDFWREPTPAEMERLLVALFDPSPLAKKLGKLVDAGFALADRWSPGWSEVLPDRWKSVPLQARMVASIAAYMGDFTIWLNHRRADRKSPDG